MIELASILLLLNQQAPLIVAPGREPSLHSRGWELVHSSEQGRQMETYIHPQSIRPASKTADIYSVTSIIRTKNRDDDGWHIGTLGYLVNCTEMTFAQEWGMGRYNDRPVLDYLSNHNFRVPAGGQFEVVKRVCEEK